MIVYRMMGINELKLFINGDMSNIGSFFPKHKYIDENNVNVSEIILEEAQCNTHNYRNQKYVHMFRNLKDMDFIQFDRDFEYLATFDIPYIILMASKGRGFYRKLKNGKFDYKFLREFAIDSKMMKPEFFLGFEEINKFELGIEECEKLLKKKKLSYSEKDFLEEHIEFLKQNNSKTTPLSSGT